MKKKKGVRNQQSAPIRFILEKESTIRYTNNSINWSRLELGLMESDHKRVQKKTKQKRTKKEKEKKTVLLFESTKKRSHRDESGIRYKQDKISIMSV